MTDAIVIADRGAEDAGHRFSWGLAIAGGVAATAVTFFLLTLGAGFGLLLVRPTVDATPSMSAFLSGGAIYFFVAQAFGFAVGGHLAGRLLGPMFESRVQEEFRAAAHGFVAWAVTVLATLSLMALAGLAAANGGNAMAALYGATTAKSDAAAPTAYLVDILFQPATGTDAARAEAGRILDAGLARGVEIAPDDGARLAGIVATQAGIARDQASARIDRMQDDVRAKAKRAADIARRTASHASLWTALSLLFGAVVAMFAAVLARNEDDREALA